MKGPLKCFSYPEESSPMGTFAGHKMAIAGSAIKLVILYCQEGLFLKRCYIEMKLTLQNF
jgi:hypothetical protein